MCFLGSPQLLGCIATDVTRFGWVATTGICSAG